jgi:hypothetical protein
MVGSFIVMAAAALLQQPGCDSLKTLSLPRATITAVESVASGTQAPGWGAGSGCAVARALPRGGHPDAVGGFSNRNGVVAAQ